MNMKRFLSIFFVLPLVFVSCDLTMDEVSQDVNKPTQVHPKTILTQLCITTFGIEYYGVQPYSWPGSGISAVAAAISTSSAAISSANTAV